MLDIIFLLNFYTLFISPDVCTEKVIMVNDYNLYVYMGDSVVFKTDSGSWSISDKVIIEYRQTDTLLMFRKYVLGGNGRIEEYSEVKKKETKYDFYNCQYNLKRNSVIFSILYSWGTGTYEKELSNESHLTKILNYSCDLFGSSDNYLLFVSGIKMFKYNFTSKEVQLIDSTSYFNMISSIIFIKNNIFLIDYNDYWQLINYDTDKSYRIDGGLNLICGNRFIWNNNIYFYDDTNQLNIVSFNVDSLKMMDNIMIPNNGSSLKDTFLGFTSIDKESQMNLYYILDVSKGYKVKERQRYVVYDLINKRIIQDSIIDKMGNYVIY